jgi:nucleoside-diphosphate-sugar epimerase
MKKTVLITGSSGFVGGFLAQNLSHYNLLCPTKTQLDLRDLNQVTELFKYYSIDTVVHCALSGRECLQSTEPVYISDGLEMFRNLWNNKHRFKKFINLGTAYECDLTKNNKLISEQEFLNHLPTTSYGLAKNITARIIKETENFYNLRLFGNFHETESNRRFFKKVIHDRQVIIENDQFIDYIYMADILPVVECIINNQLPYREINMVYEKKYRLSEMAYMLCDILDIDKNKISISGYNGNDLTGNADRLSSLNLKLIGLEKGMGRYK